MRVIVLMVSLGITLGVGPARADTDYFGQDAPPSEQQISFRVDKPRTTSQRLLVASLLGAAVVAGGIGLYYHLDSRDKSNQVAAVGNHTGRVYTPELDAVRRGALTSRDRAIIGYTTGGLFVVGTVVALYLTEPGSEAVTMNDDQPPPAPVVPVSVVVTPGGAVIGAGWSF